MRLWTWHPPKTEKHDWFAWHPVTVYVDGGLEVVWLETVTRQWTDPGEWYACWEYWKKEHWNREPCTFKNADYSPGAGESGEAKKGLHPETGAVVNEAALAKSEYSGAGRRIKEVSQSAGESGRNCFTDVPKNAVGFDRVAYQRQYMRWVRGGRKGKFEYRP